MLHDYASSHPRRGPSSLLAIALSVGLITACGGGSEPTPEPAGPSPAATKDGATTAKAGSPRPRIPVEAAPLTGDTKLKLDVTVQDRGGNEVSLASFVDGPSVVFFTNDDRRTQSALATSRLLRDVVLGGDAVGFRTLVVFDEDTSLRGIDKWFQKRRVRRGPATVAVDHDGAFAEANGWSPRTVALIDGDGTIAKLWKPSDLLAQRLGTDGFSADVLMAAWAIKDPGPEIDAETKAAAIELVKQVLATPWKKGDPIPDALIDPAKAAGLGQAVEHGVWVELFTTGDLEHPRARVTEGTLGEAIAAAAQQAIVQSKGGETWRQRRDDVTISVHVEGAPSPLPTRTVRTLWYMVEPGVHGLILRGGDGEGVMLGSEAVTDGLLTPRVRRRKKKLPKLFGIVTERAGLPPQSWTDESKTELLRFVTTSWGITRPGGPVTDLYRGNVLLPGPMTEEAIMDSIREGGRWLLGTVREEGKFDYEYFPNEDEYGKGYNIVRHAGSLYGLFEMYQLALKEEALAEDRGRYIDASARALDFVHEGLDVPAGAPDDRVCLIYKNACESGTAALTLLTFLARPEPADVPEELRAKIFREGDDAKIEGLALTIVDMIDDRGAIFRRYREVKPGGRVTKEPLYYPGEAMLALMRLFEKTGDKRWLKAAKAIGERQVELYYKKRGWPDHWVMQAIPRLYKATGDEDLAEAAMEMAWHSIGEQYPFVWNAYPDYRGAWRRTDDTPRTTRAGSRAEAIRGVLHMAWERGDEATILEDSLLELSRHLAEKQFGPNNSWWVSRPERVRGAYPMGIVDNHVRIDNNQHVLVGITGALETLRKRRGLKPDLH